MIASWMLYSMLVGILVGAAALTAERILRDRRLPTRWIWCGALLLTLGLPLATWLLPRSAPAAPSGAASAVAVLVAPVASTLGEVGLAGERGTSRFWHAVAAPLLERAEGLLVGGWLGASALLLLLMGGSLLRLRAARGSWRAREIDGTPVLVSADVGPAVLGVFHHRIVVPAWVLARGRAARELILRHEREHVRARDPLLVAAGALPALLLPWHLPLWWQYRRLRLAVEMDCDERVLVRAGAGARRRYGQLLIEVGRKNRGAFAFAAAFSEERSFLGRRIRALSESAPAHPVRRAVALAAMGGVLVAAACLVPGPDGSGLPTDPQAADAQVPETLAPHEPGESLEHAPVDARTQALREGPRYTPMTVLPRILNQPVVERAMVREYPATLRDANIGGVVWLYFLIDEDGTVLERVIAPPDDDLARGGSSGHRQLDAAALKVADVISFSPAMNHEEPVPAWVKFPIRFEVRSGALGEAPAQASHPDEIVVTGTAGTVRRREVPNAGAPPDPGSRFVDLPVSQLPPALAAPPGGVDRLVSRAAGPADPAAVDPARAQAAAAQERPTYTPMTQLPRIVNQPEVERAMVREYPTLLRDARIGGVVWVFVLIEDDGQLLRAIIAPPDADLPRGGTSGHPDLDAAALRVMNVIRFSPAMNRENPVRVGVKFPVRFEVRP